MFRYRISIYCLSLIFFILVFSANNTFAKSEGSYVLLALDVFELNVDVETTLDIQGETNFFSSRPNRYVGGRIVGHGNGSPDKTLSFGRFMGLVWGKSSFLLNWEVPGLQSFEPLESSISTIAFPIGMDANVRIGGILTVSPYVSGKFLWLIMNVEIGNEDFKGSAFKLGFDAGVKTSLKLGKLRLAAGAGWTHILNDEIEFEIDDLTFDSKTTGSSPEYFLGVELR